MAAQYNDASFTSFALLKFRLPWRTPRLAANGHGGFCNYSELFQPAAAVAILDGYGSGISRDATLGRSDVGSSAELVVGNSAEARLLSPMRMDFSI